MNGTTATRILVGYDGSMSANAAIDVGALLLPRARVWITHLWTPPFTNEGLRQRLWQGSRALNEFVEAIEREGAWEADRVAATGVALARAAGWDAEPLVQRSDGGEGFEFAGIAEKLDPDLLLVGSRGLGGGRAVLGSVSDMVVHYAQRPVLVAPYPLLRSEHAALAEGAVVVGWDGSPGAYAAVATAARLFPARELALVAVDDDAAGIAVPDGRELIALHADGHHGEPARAVAAALGDFARRRTAAVIVVGSRGSSAVREILLGSVAMATLHHGHRPIIVVPHNASERAA